MMDKKEKKKAQLKKNRRLQEIFNLMRFQRGEAERIRDQEQEERERRDSERENKAKENDELGDKVASIRNRLTDQRRISRERWNRFSGTGDEGGRGL